jgi:hypothetical protein
MAEIIPPPLPIAPPTRPTWQTSELEGFTPLCPDCRYDLAGLLDGRCPECGLRFTHDGLRRLWIARRRAKADRWKTFGRIALGVALLLPGCLISKDSPAGLAFALFFWSVCAGVWAWTNRSWWIAHSYFLLIFLAPLLFMTITVAATPFGLVASCVLGAMACGVAWMSLRWSPLISGIALLGVVVAPLSLVALLMLIESSGDMAAGRYWSSFDQPTPHGWCALPAPQSHRIALWLFAVAGAVAAVVLAYARRAIVRVRSHAKARPNPSL